mmetsp:Transcript_57879/g.103330  ORF Transcript_57879/g.103330 Transcript_57879/m.103330 type:complete len:353 (-) Transcript_57879:1272-2330(-)
MLNAAVRAPQVEAANAVVLTEQHIVLAEPERKEVQVDDAVHCGVVVPAQTDTHLGYTVGQGVPHPPAQLPFGVLGDDLVVAGGDGRSGGGLEHPLGVRGPLAAGDRAELDGPHVVALLQVHVVAEDVFGLAGVGVPHPNVAVGQAREGPRPVARHHHEEHLFDGDADVPELQNHDLVVPVPGPVLAELLHPDGLVLVPRVLGVHEVPGAGQPPVRPKAQDHQVQVHRQPTAAGPADPHAAGGHVRHVQGDGPAHFGHGTGLFLRQPRTFTQSALQQVEAAYRPIPNGLEGGPGAVGALDQLHHLHASLRHEMLRQVVSAELLDVIGRLTMCQLNVEVPYVLHPHWVGTRFLI